MIKHIGEIIALIISILTGYQIVLNAIKTKLEIKKLRLEIRRLRRGK